MGKIKAISISNRKGVRKNNVDSAQLLRHHGLENDAHGGTWHRQVSLLAQESIDFMRAKGLDVVAGNFAENITTEGIDLTTLPVGSRLTVGDAELVISQLGKICHTRCAIYHQAGDCVMPREGIFAVVRKPGRIKVGDIITVQNDTAAGLAIIATPETLQKEEDQLRLQVENAFAPGFVRLDAISPKQGGDIDAILTDLTETQRIRTIIIYDPSGKMALAMVGIDRDGQRPNWYHRHDSHILYCRERTDLHP